MYAYREHIRCCLFLQYGHLVDGSVDERRREFVYVEHRYIDSGTGLKDIHSVDSAIRHLQVK